MGSSDKEQRRLEIQSRIYNDSQYIQAKSGANICEFGCGNGGNLWVAEKIEQGNYIGIDIQKEQIDSAIEKVKIMRLNNVEFRVEDLSKENSISNWADLVFCRLVLVHNSNPISLVKNMAQAIKSKGKVLAIEPNNLSYIAYNKPYLNKCHNARVSYMYRPCNGTIDICPQLYHLFSLAGLHSIIIKQHSIYVDSRDKIALQLLYQNWMDMVDTVKDVLFERGAISREDYDLAREELENIYEGDSIYQSLWIAEGDKR